MCLVLTILCCHAILCFAFGEISLNPSIRSIHFFRPNFRHVNPSRNGKSCILDPNMLPVSISLSHLFRSEYWVIVYHCIYILQRMHFLSGVEIERLHQYNNLIFFRPYAKQCELCNNCIFFIHSLLPQSPC